MAEDLETALRGLVTEQLSSVTFIMDYWQLAFDGYGLTRLTRLTVKGAGRSVSDGDTEFRNRICDCIGHIGTGTSIRLGECLMLTLGNGYSLEASLNEQDYRGPEAVHFHSCGSNIDYIL